MPELSLIIKNFTTNNPEQVTWIVVALLLILGLLLQRTWIKEYARERKLNRLLKNIGQESLHNVTISDGLDGSIFIENLILTPNKILLLGMKKYRGIIFAAEKIDLWTQMIGNKSYKFENPLHQLENDALSLNSMVKNSTIQPMVLFLNGSEFPKGKPENVVSIADIKALGKNYVATDISEALRIDWEQLSELAVKNDSIKSKTVLVDEESTSSFNLLSMMSVLTALLLWVVWRQI